MSTTTFDPETGKFLARSPRSPTLYSFPQTLFKLSTASPFLWIDFSGFFLSRQLVEISKRRKEMWAKNGNENRVLFFPNWKLGKLET